MLTDAKVRSAKPGEKPYKLVDDHGLYLEIAVGGRKAWRFRYTLAGKESKITIGQYPLMSLSEARAERDRLRKLVDRGESPSARKQADKLARIGPGNSFKEVTEEWLGKQAERWAPSTLYSARLGLQNHVYPVIGGMPLDTIEPVHLLAILRGLEEREVGVYALQLRQMLSRIFRYGVATLRCPGDPADLLKGSIRRAPVQHARAMQADDIREFLDRLGRYRGRRTTVIALRLMLYLFPRSIELRQAEWTEWQGDLWVVPAAKMKRRRVHSVPLSKQALALVQELHGLTGEGRYWFPNQVDPERFMNATTLNRAFHYMGYGVGEWSGHDFRATASTLLNEMGFRWDLIERQLAHVEASMTRRSYNHAEWLPERREMMQKWADYVDGFSRVSNHTAPLGVTKVEIE